MPDERDDFAIRHVASLARLHLTPDEESLYARQLADILTYARRVLVVDVPSAPPGTPAPVAGPAPRPDEVKPSLAPAQVLEQAPDAASRDQAFRVPRVIG